MGNEEAEIFQGFDEVRLEELASRFSFENCLKRKGLEKVLRKHAFKSIKSWFVSMQSMQDVNLAERMGGYCLNK